jgi:hypothetical protein
MPYSIDIRPAERRAVVRGQGSADVAGTVALMRELAARPAFEPGFGVLIDVRDLAYVASFDDLIALRDVFGELRESFRGPIAVVVSDLLRYGITRSISGLTGMIGVRIEPFRDEAAAEAWLTAETAP